MKKKLYYTVEKHVQDFDGIEECTGHRTISTYSVVNGGIEKQFDVECTKEDNSQVVIEEYLIDNGMGDEEFELIIL